MTIAMIVTSLAASLHSRTPAVYRLRTGNASSRSNNQSKKGDVPRFVGASGSMCVTPIYEHFSTRALNCAGLAYHSPDYPSRSSNGVTIAAFFHPHGLSIAMRRTLQHVVICDNIAAEGLDDKNNSTGFLDRRCKKGF